MWPLVFIALGMINSFMCADDFKSGETAMAAGQLFLAVGCLVYAREVLVDDLIRRREEDRKKGGN